MSVLERVPGQSILIKHKKLGCSCGVGPLSLLRCPFVLAEFGTVSSGVEWSEVEAGKV